MKKVELFLDKKADLIFQLKTSLHFHHQHITRNSIQMKVDASKPNLIKNCNTPQV